IVITTALIPGKPAPVLITEDMVKDMKPGSVIVDLAAASGGNCPLTKPDKVVEKHGVTLIGFTNLPSRAAVDASALYARNIHTFVTTLLLSKEGHMDVKWEDELITGTLLTRDGQTTHPQFKAA
ncbi:MAG: NAD(P)(+) transhydrogenase (Re/Si-specific) subunit alpha, partial [Rickettsiales bacterium]|nr:NAD(P)(+) transhydrogenase (Re/Si-specific) subunit alpha [Rickettsiales bacterium]